jgi:hypothetical protein
MSEIPVFIEEVKPVNLTVGRALQKVGRATANTLVTLTGKPLKSVLSTIKSLHQQSKIHIGSYAVTKRGQATRVWHWGDGDDVREPSTVKHSEGFIPRPDVAAEWLRNPV